MNRQFFRGSLSTILPWHFSSNIGLFNKKGTSEVGESQVFETVQQPGVPSDAHAFVCRHFFVAQHNEEVPIFHLVDDSHNEI